MGRSRCVAQGADHHPEICDLIGDVNKVALTQLTSLLPQWLPGGRIIGHEYVCANLSGGNGRSCSINLTTGQWADFAEETRGGDPVSLFAAIHELRQGEAAMALAKALGIAGEIAPSKLSPTAPYITATRNTACKIYLPVPRDAPQPPSERRVRTGAICTTHRVSARWAYRNAQDELLGFVCRFDSPDGSKEIVPQVYGRTNNKTEWLWKSFPIPRPLYGLDRLAKAQPNTPVLLCEGEKTADAAQRLLPDAVAMTWPGGSKAVTKTDFSPLAGHKVWIWPDADKAGFQAALAVVQALTRTGTAEARIIAPPRDVKTGWDLADAEAEGWNTQNVKKHFNNHTTNPLAFSVLARNRYDLALLPQPQGQQSSIVIRIEKGAMGAAVDACEAILAKENLPLAYKIFQRGGQLVRLATLPAPTPQAGITRQEGTPLIMEARRPFLLDVLGRYGTFEKMDHRIGKPCAADPPKPVADAILDRAGMWPMPPLRGVLTCPTLRLDGSLLLTPGYDPRSGYVLVHDLAIRMPHHPTKTDALEALRYLTDLLAEFSFVSPEDHSVGLALLLSAIARPSLDHAPLFAITSPTRGSGKSTLMDTAAIIATGRRAAVLSATSDNTEFEKRLVGSLLAGDNLVSLDNYNGTLHSDLLCQALTAETVKVRPLGVSQQLDIPNTALWSANGNNLILSGDLDRRAVRCRLDPGKERPEEQVYTFNPLLLAQEHRAKYVSAILTMLQAYIIAGRPSMGGAPFGSFEQWSGLIRTTLLWLGVPDPCTCREELLAEDPDMSLLRPLLEVWWSQFGKKPMKTSQLAPMLLAPAPSFKKYSLILPEKETESIPEG